MHVKTGRNVICSIIYIKVNCSKQTLIENRRFAQQLFGMISEC